MSSYNAVDGASQGITLTSVVGHGPAAGQLPVIATENQYCNAEECQQTSDSKRSLVSEGLDPCLKGASFPLQEWAQQVQAQGWG